MKKPTPGMSLVETVVVMAVSATLAAVIVTSIAALFRYDDTVSGHMVRQTNLQQMAHTLRADIHRAKACQWSADPPTLRLTLPNNERVEYAQQHDRWVRIENSTNSDPVTTPIGLDATFRCEGSPSVARQGEIIRLQWSHTAQALAEPDQHTPRTVRHEIVAVVGRDYE